MKLRGVDQQMALDLLEAARLEPGALMLEKAWQKSAERLGGFDPGFGFFRGGIAAEPHGGEQILGGRARLTGVKSGDRPQDDTARLACNCILH